MQANRIDSVKEKIEALRQCGFFEKYYSMTAEQVFDTLHQQRVVSYSKMFERFYDPGMDLTDDQILALD